MGEEFADTMNLDLNLNLGPDPQSDLEVALNETVNLVDWTNGPSERSSEAVTRIRTRHRTRFRQLNLPISHLSETHTMAIELNQLMGTSVNGDSLQSGEGSERGNEDLKLCENDDGAIGDSVLEKKADVEKSSGSDLNFFDCNICLDLSKDPVLTCCGHLYCWSCIYQWLQISDAKECPICKGEVTVKTVTPIYGRGNHRRESEENLDTKIPMRPQAKRIENFRNTIQRAPFTIPTLEEMIRRIQSRFDRDSIPVPEASESVNNRAYSALNRLMTSRGVRSEQSQANAAAATIVAASEDIDLNPNFTPDLEGEETTTRLHPTLIRRQLQAHRVARISNFSSELSSAAERLAAERLVDMYFRPQQELNHNHAPVVVDDRDSFSSIAAVINSENQVDTAVEIDSMLTLSTSSSRRRNENWSSRVSDVDSADSRPFRRRRFT